MSAPHNKATSDWEDNQPLPSPDDIIGQTDHESPSHIPRHHRLHKTKHSPVYFSDSDDQDEAIEYSLPTLHHSPQRQAVVVAAGQTNTLDITDKAHSPPQPTRYQQQHHRRHRQFHRTFTPFDLHQLNCSEQAEPASPPHQLQSTDDDTDANALTTRKSPSPRHHPLFRDSPVHQRIAKTGQSSTSAVSPPLDTNSSSETIRKRPRGRIMLINYGPESICVLALILTTFATFQNV